MSTIGELGCHQRNVHGSGYPRNLQMLICYSMSYFPMYIALSLMLGNVIPYTYYYLYEYLYLTLYLTAESKLNSISAAATSRDQLSKTDLENEFYYHLVGPFLFYSVAVGFFLFGCMFTAYFRCVFTQPGFVDATVWCDPPRVLGTDGVLRESRAGSRNPHIVVASYQNFTPRYCDKCKIYKPDRSHHCSECGKCINKLDHHCPWVCNCVAENNHKYFLLFLLHIGFSGFHIAITIVSGHYLFAGVATMRTGQSIAHFLLSLCAGVFAAVLGLFGIFHIFLIGSEESTLERNIARLTGKIPPQQKQSWITRCLSMWTFKSLRQMIQPVMGDVTPTWQWFLPCYGPKYYHPTTGTVSETPRSMTDVILCKMREEQEMQQQKTTTVDVPVTV